FTISRVGCTNSALVVGYAVSGSASNGLDYVALTNAVTIAAGSNTASIAVLPLDDSEPECAESVVLDLLSDVSYAVGAASNATVVIADDERPTVTITASDPTAAEAGTEPG